MDSLYLKTNTMHIRPIFETNPDYHQTSPYFIPNAFTEEELEWIGNLQDLYPYQDGSIGANETSRFDDSIRKSRIKWIHHDDRSWWVYDKLVRHIQEANRSWGFAINSIIDSIQYTEYYEDGGHYEWHMDVGDYPQNNRKISLTIQLSNPNDYEGGDLEFWLGKEPNKAPREQGLAVLFPSYLMHRVTPITKGVRKSLVLWVGGDTFR
jgi:PKHD-type hydroxylase